MRVTEIATVAETRYAAASAVYQGKVAVSGGRVRGGGSYVELNTCEVYDHVANEWSIMPSMVYPKSNHGMVAVRSRLFAISPHYEFCEAFDTISNKFAVFKPPSSWLIESLHIAAASVGSKIVVFGRHSGFLKVAFYDVEGDEWGMVYWSKDYYPGQYCFCVKIPQI